MSRVFALCFFLFMTISGCGPAPSVIPTDALTEEQKKAIQEEDRRTEMEESQGNLDRAKKGSRPK